MNTRKLTGFTLLELMAVIAIIAILAAVAIPMMLQTLASSQSNAAFRDVIATLKVAKSAAIEDQSFDQLTVCASSDGVSCNNSTDWGQGWIVIGTASGVNTVLMAQGAASNLITIRVSPYTNSGGNLTVGSDIATFTLNQNGFTANNLYNCSSPPAFVFRVCTPARGSNPATGKAVIYTPGGAIRLARDTDNNGLHNIGSSGDMACP